MARDEPMRHITLRISDAEKQVLQDLAAQRDLTLSDALRDGARLLLEQPLTDGPPRRRGGRCEAS